MLDDETLQVSQEYVEKLFAHMYVELGQRTKARDEFRLYHQLNMARLVRQLLIDGTPLLNLTNRYYKLPIRFIIGDIGPAPGGLEPIPGIYADDVPDLNSFPPGYYLHPYKIGGFLASSQMMLAGQGFSVREIVKYVANHYGGVHLSPYLQDEDDQLLARFNDSVNVGGDGIVLNRIDQIARITLHALSPLMKAIQGKYAAFNGKGT